MDQVENGKVNCMRLFYLNFSRKFIVSWKREIKYKNFILYLISYSISEFWLKINWKRFSKNCERDTFLKNTPRLLTFKINIYRTFVLDYQTQNASQKLHTIKIVCSLTFTANLIAWKPPKTTHYDPKEISKQENYIIKIIFH